MSRRVLALTAAIAATALLASGCTAHSDGQDATGRNPASTPAPVPTPTQAPDPFPARVAVLGDSYSSGEGAGDYIDDGTQCHRNPHMYDVGPEAQNVACSGATTADVPAQLDQLEQPVDLVIMTIGGNDIGFAQIMSDCLTGNLDGTSGACAEQYADITDRIPDSVPALADTYRLVRETTGAPVVVLPYPGIIPTAGAQTTRCPLDDPTLAFAADVEAALDQAISQAVEAAGDPGILLADTVRGALDGHGLCQRDSWVHGLGGLQDVQELAHPTREGYTAIFRALREWAQTHDLVNQ